jgi:RHS repeat-associated protein
VLVAAVDYSADTVTDLAGPIDTYAGIVRGYAEGDLVFTADRFNGSYNNGEFEVAGNYIAPGTPVYLHTDHLGSASLSTSATGAQVSEMRYYAYGGTRSGTMDTDRRYTGQRWEAGIGLYDYNARYYDPALGQFVQADTVVPSMAHSQDFNRYSYVRGNPLVYVDPSGYDPLDAEWERQFRDAHGRGATDLDRQRRLYSIAYPGPISGGWPWTEEDWGYFIRNQDKVYRSTKNRRGIDDFKSAIDRLALYYEDGEEAQFVSALALLYAGWPYDPSGKNIISVNFDGLNPDFQPINSCGTYEYCGNAEYHVNHGMEGFADEYYYAGEENTHHYVAHLLLGYHLGALANFFVTPLREEAQGQLDVREDVAMGWAGGLHGASLRLGGRTEGLLGPTVSDFSKLVSGLCSSPFPIPHYCVK